MKRLAGAGFTLLLTALVLTPAPPAAAATFTVNDTGDASDLALDGVCDADAAPGDQCTLRAAIQEANDAAGLDMIAFDITPNTIQPSAALPEITDPVLIDGTTDPDFVSTPVVEIDGQNAGSSVDGLRITAGGSTVEALVINRFDNESISLQSAGGNTLQGNFLGTDAAGLVALGVGGGVEVLDSPNNVISANVVSGNAWGVLLSGGGATGNLVEKNVIGTDPSGTMAVPNAAGGVLLIGGASNNTIRANLISGNGGPGVEISGSAASGNNVVGNGIGTDGSRTSALPNDEHGVLIDGATGTVVGGTSSGDRNIISGNGDPLQNIHDGVLTMGGATGTVVRGNYIGTDAAGASAIPNVDDGVSVQDAVDTTVGGTIGTSPGGSCTGSCNLLSGNGQSGLVISETTDGATSGTVVRGNFVGTDATGTAAIGNVSGIVLVNVENQSIGGTTAAARNVISGGGTGVTLFGTTGTVIQGNFLGTDSSGTLAIPGALQGVTIESGSTATIVGGTAPGAGNVIVGSANNGVWVKGDGNTIAGNLIGTDVFGTLDLGNAGNGIGVSGGAGNTIGGTTPGAGNVIVNNDASGVEIEGLGASGSVVQGNWIGTDEAGADMGNAFEGVLAFNGATNTTVGGIGPDAGNAIAFNGSFGVAVTGADNPVLGNSIHDNGLLGIELNTDSIPTPNGTPGIQSYPVIAAAVSGSTAVVGSLTGDPNTKHRIEFFSSPAADPSGFGEGETFLGATAVTTDGSGDAPFARVFASTVPDGEVITTTATRLGAGGDPQDTSEFSAAQPVPTACTQTGTAGPDTLAGTPGDDVLCGGDGNDVFLSSPGNDVYVGGAGKDTATYASAAAGVRVDLAKGAATDDGDGGADALLSIENVTGSPKADVIRGDGRANRLEGLGRADLLIGGRGRDHLVGGGGKDTQRGGSGKDRLAGGGGADAQLGQGAADRLVGGPGGDRQKGGAGNDVILGQGGNDALNGGSGGRDRCRQGPGSGPVVKCEI